PPARPGPRPGHRARDLGPRLAAPAGADLREPIRDRRQHARAPAVRVARLPPPQGVRGPRLGAPARPHRAARLMLVAALSLRLAAAGVVVVAAPEPTAETPADTAWIAQAVADGLPRALGLLDVPAVERSDRLRAQESLGIPAKAALSRASAIRVAEAL